MKGQSSGSRCRFKCQKTKWLYLKCLDCRNNRNRTPPSLFLLGFAWLRMISVVFKEKRVPMHKFLLCLWCSKRRFLVFDDCWRPFEACGWIWGARLSEFAAKGNKFTATMAEIYCKNTKNFLTCLCLFLLPKDSQSWGLPSCVGYQNLRHSSDNDLLGLDSQKS